MPGKSVKNWGWYHGLRRAGYSKSSAAAISNWMVKRGSGKGKRRRG